MNNLRAAFAAPTPQSAPSFIAILIAYIIGGVAGLWIGSKVLVYVRDELGWRWNIEWLKPREIEKSPSKGDN